MSAYQTSTNFNINNSKYQANAAANGTSSQINPTNMKNSSLYGHFDGINNPTQSLGTGSIHHNSTNNFTMNNFMPSNLTSALYN